MNKLPMIARTLLGLIFFVFGLNGFLNFIPQQPMPEAAGAFAGALFNSHYFFPMLKTIEVTCGALLLVGLYVPLALVALAPIILNIFMFHAFLAPSGLPLPIVIGVLEVYLAFFAAPYAGTIKQIFKK